MKRSKTKSKKGIFTYSLNRFYKKVKAFRLYSAKKLLFNVICTTFLSSGSFIIFAQAPDIKKNKKLKEQSFEVRPEIKILAKTLLKEDYSYFNSIVNSLIKKGSNSYIELSKEFDIFNEFIKDNRPSNEISDSFIFIEISEKFKVLKSTDWSGENNQGDIKKLVNNTILNNKINWENYDSLEVRFLNPKFGYKNFEISPNGRFLIHQFDEIIKLIRPYHVNLYSINDGSDNFNLFILKDNELYKIKKLMKFKSFQSVFVDSIEELVIRTKKSKDWKQI